MNKLIPGLTGGFAGTVILSVLMIAKGMMGIMPQLDVIAMLAAMMGLPAAIAWAAHFMIGTAAWGGGFALLNNLIPGNSSLVKGVAFGVGAWLLMMVMVMPMAGAGLFGLSLGIMAPMMTLVLHVVFGAVLGKVYESMLPNKFVTA